MVCALLWSATLPLLAQQSPCDTSRRLLNAGLLDDAHKALATAAQGADAEGNSPPACVAEVTEPLARAFKERGDALTRIGQETEATAAYVKAVQLDPSLAEALESKLVAPAEGESEEEPDSFGPVRELVALGELSEARSKLIELVKGTPPAKVPADLQFLHGGRWSWWRAAREWVYGWFPTVLEVVLGLIILGFLVWWSIRGLRGLEGEGKGNWEEWPRYATRTLFLLGGSLLLAMALATCLAPEGQGISSKSLVWVFILLGFLMVLGGLNWESIPALRRELMIEEIQGKLPEGTDSKSLQATIRGQLLALAKSHQGPDIPLVTAAAENVTIPEVSTASPTAEGFRAVLVQVLKRITPKPYTISGTLHGAGRRGPGITLHFLRGKSLKATTTLWQGTYVQPKKTDSDDVKASHTLLAELAAVWILFQLKRHSRWRWQKDFELLGTADWQAVAYFQAGILAFEVRLYQESIQRFERAIYQDPDFAPAYYNLFKARAFNRAEQEREPSGYEKKYDLDLLKRTIQLLVDTTDASSKQRSLHDLWECLEEIVGPNSKPDGRVKKGTLPSHLTYATYFQASYGRILRKVGSSKDYSQPKPISSEAIELLARLSHELRQAAFFTRFGKGRHQELWWIVRDVAESIQPIILDLELRRQSIGSAKLPLVKLDKFSDRINRVSARACINFASVLSVKAKTQKQLNGDTINLAVHCLQRAERLEPFRRCQFKQDSMLAHLRSTDAYQKAFGSPKSQPTTPLAELTIISPTHARALAAEGVESLQYLLLATARKKPRRHLADKLGVSRKLILRWARLAEICRVPGLEIEAIDLLARAGIGSLGALAGLEQKDMEDLLDELGKAPETKIPFTVDDLVRWMNQANQLLPSMVRGGR